VKTGGVKVLDTLIDSTQRSKPRYAMTLKKSHYGTNGNMNESEEEVHELLSGLCEQHLVGALVYEKLQAYRFAGVGY
jgi:hypothetical protein